MKFDGGREALVCPSLLNRPPRKAVRGVVWLRGYRTTTPLGSYARLLYSYLGLALNSSVTMAASITKTTDK